MVPPSELNAENLICDIKLSTVVPASITAEDKIHHLTDMDLAMKLHYITTVHFFGGDAAEGFSIEDFKKPMFQWLQLYYPISGRIRRHDDGGGRPFIKCNDSGVRIVEAKCTTTIAEWLATVNGGDHHRLLVYHQPLLDRDFGFTPLVFLQITKFKCGGISVGMRWTHFLGDAFSALECINTWGKIMSNQKVPPHPVGSPPITHSHIIATQTSPSFCKSLKPLDPVGDNWLTPNNLKMQMHTFHITQEHLTSLLSNENKCNKIEPFEMISAIVWKSVAKIKEAKIITMCKKGKFDRTIHENVILGNTHQVIGIVEAENMSVITDSDPLEIAKMMGEFVDETNLIGKRSMGEGDGNVVDDVLVYGGTNLTFVDFEGVNLYGLVLKGKGPVFANLSIGGVGDEGAVLVVPNDGQENGGGRIMNVILPENQLLLLKDELSLGWGIF